MKGDIVERAERYLATLGLVGSDVGREMIALVRRLPVTADGVRVVPGDRVWAYGGDRMVVTGDTYSWGTRASVGGFSGPKVSDCYSTEAAARAAKEAT